MIKYSIEEHCSKVSPLISFAFSSWVLKRRRYLSVFVVTFYESREECKRHGRLTVWNIFLASLNFKSQALFSIYMFRATGRCTWRNWDTVLNDDSGGIRESIRQFLTLWMFYKSKFREFNDYVSRSCWLNKKLSKSREKLIRSLEITRCLKWKLYSWNI